MIQLPGDKREGSARGINNTDAVVGWYESAEGQIGCYSWTPAQGAIDFGANQDFTGCQAYAVSNTAEITGQITPDGGTPSAFLWSQGVFTNLGLFPEATSSVGLAVNDSGEVVGVDYTQAGSRAFLWDGTLIDLDTQHFFLVSVAASINNSGAIVGWTQESNLSDTVAVRFAHAAPLRLDQEVVDLGDWQLLTATAVTDKGVIVGSGVHAGRLHAYMLTPQ